MLNSKFGFHTTALEVVQGYDLNGYNAIVTGSNSGLGVETARALAKTGANVFMTARNIEKAQLVLEDIIKTTGNKNVYLEQLELDSLENVEAFVKRFLARNIPLNILINNAGVRGIPLTYTKDNFEKTLAVNYIGPFVLTNGLLFCLKRGASLSGKKSRVINVASIAHSWSDFNFEDPHFIKRNYDRAIAYGQSKTALMLFSVELSRLYEKEGVISISVQPGFISSTKILRNYSETVAKCIKHEIKNYEKTIEEGAAMEVWAAVGNELEEKGGLYLENLNGITKEFKTKEEISANHFGYMGYALDTNNAQKLWKLTEIMTEHMIKK